ncbi:MAG: hypothetical protein ACR5LF_08105 [Symbiopectobacterium sp.]
MLNQGRFPASGGILAATGGGAIGVAFCTTASASLGFSVASSTRFSGVCATTGSEIIGLPGTPVRNCHTSALASAMLGAIHHQRRNADFP